MTRDGFWRRLFGRRGDDAQTLTPDAPRSRREALREERDRARGVQPPRRRYVHAITEGALELIAEMAKSSHPNEYGATLRAEEGRITEVMLVPGSIGGERHAIMPLMYMPVDSSICGTVHSHPGPSAEPSDADLQLFRTFGHTHIIIHEPYNEDTWVAYDGDGRPIELEVVPF